MQSCSNIQKKRATAPDSTKLLDSKVVQSERAGLESPKKPEVASTQEAEAETAISSTEKINMSAAKEISKEVERVSQDKPAAPDAEEAEDDVEVVKMVDAVLETVSMLAEAQS